MTAVRLVMVDSKRLWIAPRELRKSDTLVRAASTRWIAFSEPDDRQHVCLRQSVAVNSDRLRTGTETKQVTGVINRDILCSAQCHSYRTGCCQRCLTKTCTRSTCTGNRLRADVDVTTVSSPAASASCLTRKQRHAGLCRLQVNLCSHVSSRQRVTIRRIQNEAGVDRFAVDGQVVGHVVSAVSTDCRESSCLRVRGSCRQAADAGRVDGVQLGKRTVSVLAGQRTGRRKRRYQHLCRSRPQCSASRQSARRHSP